MGLNRRTFIKFLAGAGAGITVTPVPWSLLDDVSIWTQNWPWIPSNIPGANNFVPTVSKYCPSNLSYMVRLVDDRPVRTLPNQEHPLGGGLTSLAAAEVQMLYSPSRVQSPLKRGPDGKLVRVTWEEAFDTLTKELQKAKSSLVAISGDETSSITELLSAFVNATGSQDTFLMPSENANVTKAWSLMGGKGIPCYDIENSDYVLAIGANILESWGTVVSNRRAFAKRSENGSSDVKAKYVFAGAMQNNTAAGADVWLPLKPGTEAILALGIANQLIALGKNADLQGFDEFKALAKEYSPEKVQALTETPAEKIKEIALELSKAKKPLIICGSGFSQGGGTAPSVLGFTLNLMLSGLNADGGIKSVANKADIMSGATKLQDLLQKDLVAYMNSGKMPKAMLFYEANPAFALPNTAKVKEALSKVEFKVSFSTFLNETAELCDLVFPIPMGLERIDDSYAPFGANSLFYSLTTPVLKTPLVDARPFDEILIKAAGSLGYSLNVKSLADAIKIKIDSLGADPKKLAQGKAFIDNQTTNEALELNADLIKSITPQKAKDPQELVLAPQFTLNMGVSVTGIPPFNTKTIPANQLKGKEMFVFLNKTTADRLGFIEGSPIKITNTNNPEQNLRARVHLFEGIVNNAIGIKLGFGHSAFDEFSQNKGYNPMEIMSINTEPGTNITTWTQTGVKAERG
ncbi:menaquinone reductase molybdopterin-binding-like subunit QrcB [Desulfovibrio litoralis]|uniref:Anaerobic selenocysteine-containing dehydrogenase n=1 Tax=Desulfovibrio litoralis DSM 11393 TaxID=1121455 RepID=A0A1M7STA8_9BACT|nr:menaquinone reductase molybdopterin-binding-like subunit QrcB [Desulfovibrio litoralis]SHN61626.1 Anaerobic selenocysteine-containing dehydrogenase [Desulfovibrio litoralis DSM 11393]